MYICDRAIFPETGINTESSQVRCLVRVIVKRPPVLLFANTVQHLFGTTVLSVLDGLESERILKVTVLLLIYTMQGLSNRLLYFGFIEKAVRRKPAPSTKREPETGTSNRMIVDPGTGGVLSCVLVTETTLRN